MKKFGVSAGGIFLLQTRNRRVCLYFPTLGPRLVRLVALEELGVIEFVVPLERCLGEYWTAMQD